MKRLAFVLTALALAFACGDDEPVQSEGRLRARPSRALGSLAGRVIDPLGQALTDARVRIVLSDGERTAATDSSGAFRFANVPAIGTVEVRVEKEGFTRAFVPARLEAEAGDYPQNEIVHDVGDILLFPLGDEVVFPVWTPTRSDVAVEDAVCVFGPTFYQRQGNGRAGRAQTHVQAESRPGEIACPNLPRLDFWSANGGWLELFVPAQDFDGDGHAEYAGYVRRYAAEELYGNAVEPIVLEPRQTDDPSVGLQIVQSNIEIYRKWEPVWPMPALKSDDVAEIVFAVPVDVVSVLVWKDSADVLERDETIVETEPDRVRFRISGGWEKGKLYVVFLVVREKESGFVEMLDGRFTVESSGEIEVRALFLDSDDDGIAAANETLRVELSEYVFGVSDGVIAVQVDADLDGSSEIGDSPYELGSDIFAVLDFESPFQPMGRKLYFRFPVEIPEGARLVFTHRDRVLLNTSGERFDIPSVTLEAEP